VWTNPLSGYVYIIYIYQWMSVQFFLHIMILNKKFWLQFICNKLISTTAHESVKIISTEWFMHISHLISVNIFLENFVWSFSVMRFLRPLVDINNINVPGQRICSHFLVQIPRADAEIVTNKLPLFFFY
jgi:hypothetical protein